jgi:predicted DNA-binding transcriptional regulator YafY
VDRFQVLSRAVLHEHRLELDYWTASRDQLTHRAVDPYHLTLIDGSWFLIGYCHLRREVRMFSTVRVRSVRDTGETFTRPPDFRLEAYLQGSFRTVRGEGHHHVVLRFHPSAAGRVAERVWHSSQKTEPDSAGGLIVHFEVSDLREIKRWILSWGSDCEVLEPEEFRSMMASELREMLQRYDSKRKVHRKPR